MRIMLFVMGSYYFDEIVDLIFKLGLFVVLPAVIVLIIGRVRRNETNRRAEIMLKALEAGIPIDSDIFRTMKRGRGVKESIKEKLMRKLRGACIESVLAGFLLFFFIRAITRWEDSIVGVNAATVHTLEVIIVLSLIAGVVLIAFGIANFVSYFSGKKLLAKEMEAEEMENLEQK